MLGNGVDERRGIRELLKEKINFTPRLHNLTFKNVLCFRNISHKSMKWVLSNSVTK